jgi:Tfp pilus assembly protein PilO
MNAAALKRQLQSLGTPGIGGALALLLAIGLLLLAHAWDGQAAALQTEADALRTSLRARRASAVEAPAVTPQQWQANLPPATERQQRLADLLEMSLRAGLAGSRTEHRLTLDAASGLERLRVSMPVSGGYAQLRQFIGAALEHDPALSLDSLKLRRNTPMAAEVEAELVWSLHSRIEVRP